MRLGGIELKRKPIYTLIAVMLLVVPLAVYSESITDIKEKIQTLADQRQSLEGDITNFTSQLTFLETEFNKTNDEVKKTEADLKKIEAELSVQNEYLRENLRVIYEEDQKSFLEVLLMSRTFSDFVDRNEYLSITRQRLKDNTERIKGLKKDSQEKKSKLVMLTEIQRVIKESIERQKAEKETALTNVIQEELKIRQKFSERLIGAGKNPYCRGQGNVVKAKYPVFAFPVECGYISQGYGNTQFASIDRAYGGAIHNGFDVGVATGTRLLSVGKGTVYSKGISPSGGWGNWVIVKLDSVNINNRPTEFYALYAHMIAESHVKVGDRINQNDVVGFVGGTPDWAPHLHFSLFASSSGWSNGTVGPYPGNTVDPLNYMDIPISVSGTDWDPQYLHI